MRGAAPGRPLGCVAAPGSADGRLLPQRKAAEKAEKAPKSKGKKDPKAPKRALSAYMFFSQDWRERIKSENPDAGFGESVVVLRFAGKVG